MYTDHQRNTRANVNQRFQLRIQSVQQDKLPRAPKTDERGATKCPVNLRNGPIEKWFLQIHLNNQFRIHDSLHNQTIAILETSN